MPPGGQSGGVSVNTELSAYDARKRADQAAGSLAQRRDAGTRQAPCSQRMPDTRLTAWHRLPCHPRGRPTSHRQSPKLGRHSSPFSASHRPRVHIFTRVRARGFVSTAPAGLTNTPSWPDAVRCLPGVLGWPLHPLRSTSVFVSVAHCFDYYRFFVKFNNWKCEFYN